MSSAGTGITFGPALSDSHAAGATVTGVGTYTNDNGSQINFNNIGSADTYTGGLRGGLRFEAIELRTPGTIELSGAGLNFKAYRATPDAYQGWFLSSDEQLNRMWYAGAYTAQMDMVPGRAFRPASRSPSSSTEPSATAPSGPAISRSATRWRCSHSDRTPPRT